MRHKKNITLNLRSITSHFTEKKKIITLSLIIIMLSFTNITLSLSDTFYNSNVSALSYQGSAEIKFTFNPTLSINISTSDLVIDNLTPGTTSDSNIVNVSVATNASHGYTLSATVGDSLHNNNDLVHTNNTDIFSSIATDSSLPSLTTDNTWGYSYRLSNNNNNSNNSSNSDTGNSSDSNTWSNYSGLSNETSKTLVNTDSQIAKPIDFKISAKASSTQPSGTYTNTINFIAISKPIPKTIEDIVYMQTFGELLPTDLQSVKDSMEEEHTYTLKDARDEQDYTIAKLKDGKIWMTKNLNLAGGTEIATELSDVPANYTLPTANGFQEGNKLPESSQTGFDSASKAKIYNSNNIKCDDNNVPCLSYYSWTTAAAGSGLTLSKDNTDAPYSICPKGWRLPNSRSSVAGDSDLYQLAIAYGMDPSVISQSTTNFYDNAGPGTIPNFTITGGYYGSGLFGDTQGYYWSSTSYSVPARVRFLRFNTTDVNSATVDLHWFGFAVRCLAR